MIDFYTAATPCSNEDVAILGGGLIREYLGVGNKIDCS